MIEMKNVNKFYSDGFHALKDINLTFRKGEITVLIGPSGCGKSTTMKLINRLITPTNGTILINEENIGSIDPVKLRRNIGYVIQSIGLFPHMTIVKRGDLDVATLYSDEIFNNHFPIEDTRDREAVLQQAKEGFDRYFGFKWFDPLGFENTYAFSVRKEVAAKRGYTKISDVTPDADSMRLGVDTTWLERPSDGYPAFTRHYGFTFGSTFPMELALVYSAVANKQVDIVLAYSTDSRLKAYNLITLEDDKRFFPPFDASTVMRKDAIEKYPEAEAALSELIGTLDVDTMIDLNYQVDIEKKSEREVALAYLRKVGLLKE